MANESSIPGSPKNNTFPRNTLLHKNIESSITMYMKKASISMRILEWIMFYKTLKGTSEC